MNVFIKALILDLFWNFLWFCGGFCGINSSIIILSKKLPFLDDFKSQGKKENS